MAVQRERGRTRRSHWSRAGLAAGAAVLVASACTGSSTAGPSGTTGATGGSGGTAPGAPAEAPPKQVPPLLDQQKVDGAVSQLDGVVQQAMDKTGVPGVAVAVVYHDKVVYSKGFGLREVGKPDKVDENTVFLLASVSKPLASTVVAGVVGEGAVKSFDEPIATYTDEVRFKDPYVTQHATFADSLSHRTGWFTSSGDLLEDLGWDQQYIYAHLDQQPLDPFRQNYHYSNFGYSAAGVGAAAAKKTSWEDLADATLFQPLGMSSTSYRHADYEGRANRASIHVPDGQYGNKRWVAKYERDADAEAPAGGASSSVADMAKWVRLQLADGTYDGKQVIDADALAETHVPHQELGAPASSAARTRFYGLGWNVSYDDLGRVKLDHSGAFLLGTATNVSLLPGEGLGIVTLTNGQPHGLPEAVNATFFDLATYGHPTVDWLPFAEKQWDALYAGEVPEGQTDYSKAPATPTAARADATYVGTYANSYYGPLTVRSIDGKLSMSMGPPDKPTSFPLTHYDGDTFSFETIGENQSGLSGAVFSVAGEQAASVKLEFYDQTGLGTFTR